VTFQGFNGRWETVCRRVAYKLFLLGRSRSAGQQSAGKALFQMMGVFTEFERSIIAE
jgi:hypothetical protein